MSGCDDNVKVASDLVLETAPSRRKRNIDTKALVVEHNNKVGIQVKFNFVIPVLNCLFRCETLCIILVFRSRFIFVFCPLFERSPSAGTARHGDAGLQVPRHVRHLRH